MNYSIIYYPYYVSGIIQEYRFPPLHQPPSWGAVGDILNNPWAGELRTMTWGKQSHLLGEPPASPGGTARTGYTNALLIRNSKNPKGKPGWGINAFVQFGQWTSSSTNAKCIRKYAGYFWNESKNVVGDEAPDPPKPQTRVNAN